jgi:hypothetical protein
MNPRDKELIDGLRRMGQVLSEKRQATLNEAADRISTLASIVKKKNFELGYLVGKGLKWDYEIDEIPKFDLQASLQERGEQNWELCTVLPYHTDEKGYQYRVIYRKPRYVGNVNDQKGLHDS